MNFNVLKLNKQLAALVTENGTLVASLAAKEQELTEAREFIETLTADKVALSTQVESLKTEVENSKKSSNRQAAETLATLGVPAGTVVETAAANEPSVTQLMEQLGNLQKTDPAGAAQLYKQFRDKFTQNRK